MLFGGGSKNIYCFAAIATCSPIVVTNDRTFDIEIVFCQLNTVIFSRLKAVLIIAL
jgi:hypothetical protein